MPESEWQPQTEVSAEEWQPQTERTPVKSHTRKKRGGVREAKNLAAQARLSVISPTLGAISPEAYGSLGGAAGGFAGRPFGGQPGAIAGAGLLGGAGEAFAQFQRGEFDPAAIGREGAIQGGFEAAGGLALKGAKFVAKPLMRWGMKAAPEVATTALREGITATKQGVNKILAKIGETSAEALRIATRAGRQGMRYQTADIATELERRMLPGLGVTTQNIAQRNKLAELSTNLVRGHPDFLQPDVLYKLMQDSNAASAPIFKKLAAKEPVAAADLFEAKWHRAFSEHAKELLALIQNRSPGTTGPLANKTIAELLSRNSELIDVKNAAAPIVRKGKGLGQRLFERSGPAAVGGSIGALSGGDTFEERAKRGVGGAALAAGITHPAVLTFLALHFPQFLGQAVTQGGRTIEAAQ